MGVAVLSGLLRAASFCNSRLDSQLDIREDMSSAVFMPVDPDLYWQKSVSKTKLKTIVCL
jgi:hypothetical protein